MDLNQRTELRDILFSCKFKMSHNNVEYSENVFEFLSVEPDENDPELTVIHYAFAKPVWDRANCKKDPDGFIEEILDETPFKNFKISLEYHNYLAHGWHRPWELTAKSDSRSFPVIVVYEKDDGSVTGALMSDSRGGERTSVETADLYPEPEDALNIITFLRSLDVNTKYSCWYKNFNIDAKSLQEAIKSTPQTQAGQKGILVYKESDGEWFDCLWNQLRDDENEEEYLKKGGLQTYSIADREGVAVSKKKLEKRKGIDTVIKNQTIEGDYDVFIRSLVLMKGSGVEWGKCYEKHPAVTNLCDWWNKNAPEPMRFAGVFRVYAWDEENKIFIAGDNEEPSLKAEDMASQKCMSVFQREGQTTFAAIFFRGKKFNKAGGRFGTQTFRADGSDGWDVGLRLHEVDESLYTAVGLQSLFDWIK